MNRETKPLRDRHRAAIAAAKAVPDFAKRLDLLQRCDELARKTRTIERANEK